MADTIGEAPVTLVKLRHDGLGVRTQQPASAARHLLSAGWVADDQEAADALGTEYVAAEDAPSEPEPGKTAKELRAGKSSGTSKTSGSKSTSKSADDVKE